MDVDKVLAEMSSAEQTVTVTVGELKFDVTWDPIRFTPAASSAFEAARQGGDDAAEAEAAASLVETVVTDWGLSRGGEPIPLTPLGVRSVPIVVLLVIILAIGEASEVNPQKPSRSGGGRPRAAASTRRRSGSG